MSWNTCRDRRILLLPKNDVFASLTLHNLLTVGYCGDKQNNIPLYRMVIVSDMRDIKVGIHKLSMMKKLAKNTEMGVHILNLPHLLVQNWTSRHVLQLYGTVKNLFAFSSIKKRRCLKTIAWKTYYNILCDKKGYLVGEQSPKN